MFESVDTSLYTINQADYDFYTLTTSVKKSEENMIVDIIYLRDKTDSILCKIIEDKVVFLKYNSLNPFDTATHLIEKKDYDYYTLNYEKNIVKEKQIEYPINLEKPQIGAYKNFEEFINNEPSFQCDFIVKKRSSFDISMNGGNDYKVKPNDSIATYYKIKKEFWGVCDGENIYINCYKIGKGVHYSKLSIKGTVAIFYAFAGKITNEAFMFGPIVGAMAGASAAHERDLFILELKNGLIKRFGD